MNYDQKGSDKRSLKEGGMPPCIQDWEHTPHGRPQGLRLDRLAKQILRDQLKNRGPPCGAWREMAFDKVMMSCNGHGQRLNGKGNNTRRSDERHGQQIAGTSTELACEMCFRCRDLVQSLIGW